MKKLCDYSDERFKGICMHCGRELGQGKTNKEHVPTKALLDKPYPEGLKPIDVHATCNENYSRDEEYLSALLPSVLSGSTRPDPKQYPGAAKALQHSPGLRTRIEASWAVQYTLWGTPEVRWFPETKRVSRVIVKNARGHAYYELGVPIATEPSSVFVGPLCLMTPNEREVFEMGGDWSQVAGWSEVGSRLMQRELMVDGDMGPGGWIEVQPGVYRYAAFDSGDGVSIKIVLREYLAAEILWDSSI